MLPTVCSANPSRRFPSDVEERLRLMESPEMVHPEMEIPVATCSEERDETSKASIDVSGDLETSFNTSSAVEVAAARATEHIVEHSTEAETVVGEFAESSDTNPESKVPLAYVETNPESKVLEPCAKEDGYLHSSKSERTETLLQHLAEFTNMPASQGAPFSIEFRMMLQILESSAQQQKLLHQVNDRVEYMQAELEHRLDNFQCELTNVRCIPWPQQFDYNAPQPEAHPIKQAPAGNSAMDYALESSAMPIDDGHEAYAHPPEVSLEPQQQQIHIQPTPFSRQSSPGMNSEGSALPVGAMSSQFIDLPPQVTDKNSDDDELPPTPPPEATASDDQEWVKPLEKTGEESGEKLISRVKSGLGDARVRASRVWRQQAYTEVSKNNCLRRMIQHHYFDAVCAVVISTNALTIGIQAQLDVEFALNSHVLTSTLPRASWIAFMDKIYIAFYFAELSIKLAVLRCNFFSGPDNKWNIFDFVLVIAGIYDLIMELTPLSFGGDLGFTWLRIVRLLKMLKMLRVVRVMRFFQQLRLMVTSIAGSLTTLFWSVVMMSMILYTFGLCFLQAVTSHLTQENLHLDDEGMADETREGIAMYWSSILQSCITLYFAVTGGADWEQLAAPIKTSDPMFYALFFVYIMFMSVAVLNVLTGMFVDRAMKVSEQDEENVIEELEQKPEVTRFKSFVKMQARKMACEEQGIDFVEDPIADDEEEQKEGDSFLTSEVLNAVGGEDRAIQEFYNALEITVDDGHRVFRMLDPEKTNKVRIEEFVSGCLAAKGNIVGLNLIFLVSETKRLAQQLTIFTLYTEERFEEIYAGFRGLGTTMPHMTSLRQKYLDAKCVHHMTHDHDHKQKMDFGAQKSKDKKSKRGSRSSDAELNESLNQVRQKFSMKS